MNTVFHKPSHRSSVAAWPLLLLLLTGAFVPGLSNSLHAQDDYFPLPSRNPGKFGYPFPAPVANEPGVTLFHRYMLDGYPELEFCPRPQDEIWVVSSREISTCERVTSSDRFLCKHPVGTAWNRVPLEQLLDVQQQNPEKANIIFIHGNRTSDFWARRRGKLTYQYLIANNPVEMPPVRYIIWSWPSDAVNGPVKDFWKKINRAKYDGELLGQFIGMLNPAQQLTFLTHSMGAQVAFTGIQAASLNQPIRPRFDVISMAPVTHCNWPRNMTEADIISAQINRLCFIRNPSDIAIRAYKKLCTHESKHPFVAGADIISSIHPNSQQYDASQSLGCEHNIIGYVTTPPVRCELQSILR